LASGVQFCEAGIGYGESTCGTAIPSSASKLLIKGGTVVNAHHQQVADVYIEDGIIVSVQPNIMVLHIFLFDLNSMTEFPFYIVMKRRKKKPQFRYCLYPLI
jgi:hypothetical protein